MRRLMVFMSSVLVIMLAACIGPAAESTFSPEPTSLPEASSTPEASPTPDATATPDTILEARLGGSYVDDSFDDLVVFGVVENPTETSYRGTTVDVQLLDAAGTQVTAQSYRTQPVPAGTTIAFMTSFDEDEYKGTDEIDVNISDTMQADTTYEPLDVMVKDATDVTSTMGVYEVVADVTNITGSDLARGWAFGLFYDTEGNLVATGQAFPLSTSDEGFAAGSTDEIIFSPDGASGEIADFEVVAFGEAP